MSPRPSVRDVIQGLRREGQLDDVAESRAHSTLEALQRTSTASPWYVKALAGVGAWISALFVLSFFGCIGLLNEEAAFIVLGLLFCVGGTVLRRLGHGAFIEQLALASVLSGMGLVTAGVARLTEETSPTAVAAIIVGAGLIAAFPDVILRVIATLTLVGATMVLLWDTSGVLGTDIGLFACAALTHVLFIFQPRLSSGRLGEPVSSVALGLASSIPPLLLGRGAFNALDAMFRFGSHETLPPPAAGLTLALTALTLYTAWHIMKELDLEPTSGAGAGVFAALTLMALLTLHTPAVIASVGLLLCGFLRRNILVQGIAVGFLLISGSWYYYDLSLTLLAKSGTLVGSGAVLLALRWFLARRSPRAAATVEA
ncbi:DUF4401 domain-containing protein [Myxococcus stipitatus]|uniref:DUF4401 domain-containing protein n=1 Tax=Myxococcus stipitatus TaxID=83455 RepID=UPI0030CE77C2